MEKLKNLVENNLDSSSRFENLEEEMFDYQLQYIEKLQEGVLKPLHEEVKGYKETFFDYISEYTNFREYLTDKYCKIMGKSMYENKEERDKFNQWYSSIINEVILSHDADGKNYRNNIGKIFKNGFDKLTPIPEADNKYLNNNEDEERAGLIHFNTTKALDEFKDFGINKGDDCISIHFKDLIQQKNKEGTVSNIFSGESLSALAVKIIEKYPETKAIIAESWLVDSSIGKRVGLVSSKRIDSVVQDSRFWGQFVDEKGKVKKDKIQKFLNTGIPEHYVTDGFIMTEDFLKRYLPKEYKGKTIKLKEVSPESKSFREGIDKIVEMVKENWVKLSFDEIFSLINNNTFLANFYKTEDGEKHKKMLMEFKKTGLKTMDDFVYDFKEDINNKFNEYLNSRKYDYVEKEVFIP